MPKYNAIRFITESEYNVIQDNNGSILPIENDRPWGKGKGVYVWPLLDSNEKELKVLANYLESTANEKYTKIARLNLPNGLRNRIGEYPVALIDETLSFEVQEDSVAGEMYLVPEHHLKQVPSKYVVEIVDINSINESTENGREFSIIEKEDVMTFMQLFKEWAVVDITQENIVKNLFKDDDFNFVDEGGFEYGGLPITVKYSYLPIITDGIASVKLVTLEQGDKFAVIIPVNVPETYIILQDDLGKIDDVNTDYNLAVEFYNFEAGQQLSDFASMVYTSIGEESPAFKLTPQGEIDLHLEGDGADTEQGLGNTNVPMGGGSDFDFEAEDSISLSEVPDIDANLEAFSKFKDYDGKVLTETKDLLRKLPNTLRENIKLIRINNSNVYALEVDNKSIYESYGAINKRAKEILTTIGETIRESKDIQLVDSLMVDGKRLFIITETNNSNLWYAATDKVVTLTENKGSIIVPSKRDLIKLERTNVRVENRKHKAYIYGNNIAFLRG